MRTKALRHRVVALEIDVVKRGRVSVPPGDLAFFGAHHVRRRLQMHATASHRPFDQRDLEFNRRSRPDHARREKKNSGGADIFRHQSDGDGFGEVADLGQAQRQVQASSRLAPPFLRHANRMRRHA